MEGPFPAPEIMVSEEVASPVVLIGDRDPVILFPGDLVSTLTDAELEAAVAHELAHLTLRRPACFSSATLERWTGINPMARLVRDRLRQEEEKACDDMAVAALGQPTVYAEMLLKSYRFALDRRTGWVRRLGVVARLLGGRPALTERIERLLRPTNGLERPWVQRAAAAGVWCLVLVLFIS
jgi:beta-lactamase regulating signal transducer with metallopeptidase domain